MIDVKWIKKTVPDKIVSIKDFKRFVIVELSNMRIRIDKVAVRDAHNAQVAIEDTTDEIMEEIEKNQIDSEYEQE